MVASRSSDGKDVYFVEGEGLVSASASDEPMPPTGVPPFRYSRLGPRGNLPRLGVRRRIAAAMTTGPNPSGTVPSGYTYLAQLVFNDLTFDGTRVASADALSPADLLQGRSPTLDLDGVYGAGPRDESSRRFYRDDTHLRIGRTTRAGTDVARDGFDLPRSGGGESLEEARTALVPDPRNDQHLGVAQTHTALIRFHNRVVDTLPDDVPRPLRFRRARHLATMHYQWMLRHDFLPRVCDPDTLDDVFTHGRRIVEPDAAPFSMPTLPLEFALAAARFGHAMMRDGYSWNARWPDGSATPDLLFAHTATSGDLGGLASLPSSWIVDWRLFYRFPDAGRDDLAAPVGQFNRAKRLDPRLGDATSRLPRGVWSGVPDGMGTMAANLAFRNLTRAGVLRLASGQQMVELMRSRRLAVPPLTPEQILVGDRGPSLRDLTDAQRQAVTERTPLWFYVLREAELAGGHLCGVGARIVAETFHRVMEGSRHSLVRDTAFRPTLGEVEGRFDMADLLLFAFEGKKSLLAPLGDFS